MSDLNLKVLVELDVIFDTRLGTLALIDETYPAKALANNYLLRKSDDFAAMVPGLELHQYQIQYAKRDLLTIANTRLTNFILNLKLIFERAYQELPSKPFVAKRTLYVNMWPYVVDGNLQSIIKDAIRLHCGDTFDIECVNYPITTLTPSFIKHSFTHVAMYDYDAWDTLHRAELIKNPMPSVSFTIPKLFKVGTKTDATLHIEGFGPMPAHSVVVLSMKEYITLEYEEPFAFSIFACND